MEKKTRKQYSAEFKAKVVKEMLKEEKTVGQLAAEYGVHSNMLYRWRDQALAALPGLFSDQAAQELVQKEEAWQQEREALYAEIGRLSTQLTWVEKNLRDLASREERRQLIEWEPQELPISMQAQLLSLNRSGLYYQPAPPSAEEVALKHGIDEIYTAHPYYGYRRIAAQLHREELSINQKTVARYMQEMGLAAIYPGPNLSKRAHESSSVMPTVSQSFKRCDMLYLLGGAPRVGKTILAQRLCTTRSVGWISTDLLMDLLRVANAPGRKMKWDAAPEAITAAAEWFF